MDWWNTFIPGAVLVDLLLLAGIMGCVLGRFVSGRW